MNQISTTLHSIASDIYEELGSGFDEVPPEEEPEIIQ